MRRLLALPFAILVVAIYAACGTDAQGVETCRKIETARCQAAPSCHASLANPPHPGDDVQGCIDFYHDACLHGLEVNDPGGPSADACVKDILGQTGNTSIDSIHCDYVLHPEVAPDCAWLVPAATADAGEDAAPADDGAVTDDDASDGATE